MIARASGAPDRLGFAAADGRELGWLFTTRRLPPQGTARPKLDQFLAFADALGLPPAPVEFGITPTADDERAAATLVAGLAPPLIVASVGSSCPSRRWLPARTAAVLDGLTARTGGSGLLVGTTLDAPFAAAVVRTSRGRVRDLVGRTTLRQLVGVLAGAGVVFGPDSGALHLAAALGRPVVSLWGATSAARSTPFGSERYVVQGEAPCAPCFLTRCPIGRVCMQAITVETVAAHAAEALAA
jgi:ADP-heptose:LPS heptosyltransferase